MNTGFMFSGFNPPDYITAEANEIIAHIKDYAPLGSNIASNLEFDRGKYYGDIEIVYKRGSLRVTSFGIHPVEALRSLEKSALSKIKKVKETRFFWMEDRLTRPSANPSQELETKTRKTRKGENYESIKLLQP